MSTSPSKLIAEAGPIATLPSIYQQINDAVEDPETSFSRIGKIISQDASLSARLLKIVNSSFYGFPNKVDTITHAITVIGTAQLRDLVLATTVIEKFKGVPEDIIDMKAYWLHSLACGLTARIMATYCRERSTERFYVMGILHDLGRLVMYLNIPEQMREVIEKAKSENILLHKAEHDVLGFDHTEVGAELIRTWKLSNSLLDSVSQCHEPKPNSEFSKEAAILHVSDVVVHAMEFGTSGEKCVPPLDNTAWERVGLSASVLSAIVGVLDDQLTDSIQMFL